MSSPRRVAGVLLASVILGLFLGGVAYPLFYYTCDKTVGGPSCPASCSVGFWDPCPFGVTTCNVTQPPRALGGCQPYGLFAYCSTPGSCPGTCAGYPTYACTCDGSPNSCN